MPDKKLLAYTFRLLSRRAYSTKQLEDKLKTRTDQPLVIEEIIEYLNKNKFLNDYEFAKSFVRTRLNKHKGKFLIKIELQQKGIPPEITSQVLEESLPTSANEINTAKQFLTKKTSWNTLSPFDYKKKAYSALKNRGFSHETILAAIDEIGQFE